MHHFEAKSAQRDEMIDITPQVREIVARAKSSGGVVTVFVPHTTAGITINENADPDVPHDLLRQLDAMVPWSQPFYRHTEGNSASHMKASLVGSSVTVLIDDDGQLLLGRWQGIFLCEFDGPRTRSVWVRVGK